MTDDVQPIEIQAPHEYTGHQDDYFQIFLAGAIDMGNAEDWQADLLDDIDHDCVVFNPRRDDYAAEEDQKIDNPYFAEQVNWELDHIRQSDLVVFFFPENSKAPISFMELGYASQINQCVVFCEEGFYRKGNIDIFCDREGINVHTDYDSFIDELNDVIAVNGPLGNKYLD